MRLNKFNFYVGGNGKSPQTGKDVNSLVPESQEKT